MSRIEITMPVPARRAAWYRAEGWWGGRALADGLEAAAAERPDAMAVADNGLRLSYAELGRAVGGGVAHMAGHGVGPEQGIVLIAGNTVDGVIAYHAVLRSGAPVIVLDRRCGPAEVRTALGLLDAPARVIVPHAERQRLLGGVDVDVLDLEGFGDVPPAERVLAARQPDRDVAALVLFTSGTTGRPKGVVHSLNTLTAGAANMARITAADADSVLFLVSPLTSIAGIMQVHLAADVHAALVLEDRFDADASLDRINAAGATILGGAPVIAERLLKAARNRRAGRISLRTLALGGAMLPRPLLELATDAFGIEIARVYGSSEAPNFSGSVPSDHREQRLSDDGALMPGSEIHVGSVSGAREGMVRGPGVFLGYADPRDNDEAFEDGWFHTGDLIEANAGRLTVVGRLKEVVNRNGLKISLTETEEALIGIGGVREYACFGVPDASTGERLAVAVLPEDGVTIDLDDVVAHLLAAGMARRKLPEELVIWDEPLPRTASGKVVRSRLATESSAKRSQPKESKSTSKPTQS